MGKPFVRKLPDNLTSYDFLKALAVITMVIEYLGIYLFPGQAGWRIVGQMSLPIWMFLIGYAQTRDIPDFLWGGALVLVISGFVVGQSIFPLNVLVTIMIIRLAIDAVMRFTLTNFQSMFLAVFALTLLIFPTMFFVEYGTQALLFAMFGYLVRHQEKIRFSNEAILVFMTAVFFIYIVMQKINVGLDNTEFFTMGAGVLVICLLLSFFRPKLYPDLTQRLPDMAVYVLKLMGRRTLEIYIVLLLLLKAAGLGLFPERFGLFQWSFF